MRRRLLRIPVFLALMGAANRFHHLRRFEAMSHAGLDQLRCWARNGPHGMSALSPLSGVERTSSQLAATSEFDPACVRFHTAWTRLGLVMASV
jgi:hypothetical protein